MAKTKAPDSNVEYFYYEVNLTIDPPLPDSKVKSCSSDYLACRQHKDEDVTLDGSGNIVVVTNNVTLVEAANPKNQNNYGYETLKAGVTNLAKVANDAGSKLVGDVIVKHQDDDEQAVMFRLRPDNGKVVVEAARVSLGWPDGTNSPSPW